MKIVFQLLFLFVFTLSYADDFRQTRIISLKKDELKKIFVKYEDKTKLLSFRWTMYKNGGLVLFRSYDSIVSQHLLYLNHTNQSFRVKLKPAINFYNEPYMLIRFMEFDFKTKESKFELLLSDRIGNIRLEYDKEQKE